MKRIIKQSVLPALIVLLALTGCTKKSNPVGDNWSDVRPVTFSDTLFTLGFTYPYETRMTGRETSLPCGNYQGREAVVIMQFANLPETIEMDSVGVLKLTAFKRSPLRRDPLQLQLYRLNRNWVADSTDVITDAEMTPLDMPLFTVPDTISIDGTELEIELPIAVLENWQVEGVDGLNVAIKVAGDGYIDLRSMETVSGARLIFSYRVPDDATVYSYNSRPNKDSYRITGNATALENNRWLLRNLVPARFLVGFEINNSRFKDNQGVVLDDIQLKRTTINKAELVLYIKSNPYYTNLQYALLPLNITADSINVPVAVTEGQSEILLNLGSSGYVVGDSIAINITPLIQAYTSGDRVNKGMIVQSLHELLNFGEIEFWHFADAPDGKRPFIRITYTPPYLGSGKGSTPLSPALKPEEILSPGTTASAR
ncbi:MAG: hypothetical protein FJ042_06940 [Candidatus Cloacimonetes bacterium]|nr:hypothetical protein [Candidatus Cloacimonadota bacterium]